MPGLDADRFMQLVGESPEVRWEASGLGGPPPRDGWASFDRTPWHHPHLTRENLAEFRAFSDGVMASIGAGPGAPFEPVDVGFVGNMANINYTRAAPLRRRGLRAPVYVHPADRFLLGQPEWEEYDGGVPFGHDMSVFPDDLPLVADIERPAFTDQWPRHLSEGAYPRDSLPDLLTSPDILSMLPLFGMLGRHEVLQAAQFQYAAYMSRRPYIFGQSGGEIWMEPARDDAYGRLQRRALEGAAVILTSNPITLAHMRRYGWAHSLYVPWFLDDEVYAPGPADMREGWRERMGGDFFVLMSARIDDHWKGSQIALEGFARFAAHHPGARLVTLRWGAEEASLDERLRALGIADRVLILPCVGKRRLVRLLRSADALIEQFVLGYYGGSALEALACGTPVVMRLEAEQYAGLLEGDIPPVLQAATAEEVAGRLRELAASEARAADVRRRSRDWFLRNHAASTWMGPYTRLLRHVASGRPLPFAGSPLVRPKSRAEMDYEAAQLAGAPVFPSYV